MRRLYDLIARLIPSRQTPRIRPHDDVVFLDVRTRPEFAAGHAAGAVHVPLGQLPDRIAELEPHRDRRILVYCLSGHRADRAVRHLRDRGFRRAENAGGIGGLRRLGVPVERGD